MKEVPQNLAPPADSGLRCPKCEYNLTGIAEDRCPECGERFDREHLLDVLSGAPALIPIWDDESQSLFVRFIRICLLTWFAPRRLARMFPQRYSFRSARRFRLLALLPGGVLWIFWVLSAGFYSGREAAWVFTRGISILAGVVVCEAFIAGFFDRCLRPHQAPRVPDASESLAGLVGMFRSFFVLATLLCAASFLGNALDYRFQWVFLEPGILLIGLWWWLALAAVVTVQPASLSRRLGARLAIPVSVILSAIASGFVSMLVRAALGALR